MSSWTRPLIGVGSVPLHENHSRAVMFVCDRDDDGSLQPIGTAFMVGEPTPDGGWFKYFVTAAHVVRDRPQTWIRLRREKGLPEDKEVGRWVFHQDQDVAITPCDLDLSGFVWAFQAEEHFADTWHNKIPIRLGEAAYFMGLFAHVDTMADRAIPMMRGGCVGALYQERIAMRDGDHLREERYAHLIDCYSRSGFSGSPVFIDHPIVNLEINESTELPAARMSSLVALLGILIGHFGSIGDNAGVAVVAPVEVIRDLFRDEEIKQWKERNLRDIQKTRDLRREEGAASPDSIPGTVEFDRFEDLTRKLVQTPKPKPENDLGDHGSNGAES